MLAIFARESKSCLNNPVNHLGESRRPVRLSHLVTGLFHCRVHGLYTQVRHSRRRIARQQSSLSTAEQGLEDEFLSAGWISCRGQVTDHALLSAAWTNCRGQVSRVILPEISSLGWSSLLGGGQITCFLFGNYYDVRETFLQECNNEKEVFNMFFICFSIQC